MGSKSMEHMWKLLVALTITWGQEHESGYLQKKQMREGLPIHIINKKFSALRSKGVSFDIGKMKTIDFAKKNGP